MTLGSMKPSLTDNLKFETLGTIFKEFEKVLINRNIICKNRKSFYQEDLDFLSQKFALCFFK